MPQVSNRQGTIEYLDQAMRSMQSSPNFDSAAAKGILSTLTGPDSYTGRGLVRVYSMLLPRGSGRARPELSMEDLPWAANFAANEQITKKFSNDPRLTNPVGVYYAPPVNQLREAIERNDSGATIRSLDDLRTALIWQ